MKGLIMKNKYTKSAKALNKIRSMIFDYSVDKEAKAEKVLSYLKERKMRDRKNERINKPCKHWMYACE
jgi:hypothetical protein